MSNIYQGLKPPLPSAAFSTEKQTAQTLPFDKPRKQLNFNNLARLATIPARGLLFNQDDDDSKVVIYMPHLPEELVFARENQYDTSGHNLIMPDGLWIYQSTTPLELGVSFRLHAFDDLCPEGPNTLLDIAARLESLKMPVSNDPLRNSSKAPSAVESATRSSSQEFIEASFNEVPTGTSSSSSTRGDSEFKYPPACSLRLIQAGSRGFGVNMVGFVKSTKVTLHGPFLQTSRSDEFNLPSAATYEFTFVHNPSYTNLLGSGTYVNAYGPDILEYFYNTAHLGALTKNRYADVADLDSGRTA